ncbi:hypothetical protein CN514_00990 [Bacillus sp. AFS001701]|uniref:hypothetical protein n=1 Tax=Bacillus sp. AFS001701 TaxID=2033480 RepID=UPI000BFA3783|nr:hypothetical protein [Bacillus sp. AFS001701]PET77603.1 hypothetical protein CN514_00990 [Bacillus sp. AFS001701]
MTVYSFRIGPYARDIYIYGRQKLATIPAEYYTPVENYAAKNFTRGQILNALEPGYITQEQYDETVALITEEVVLPMSAPTNDLM